MYVSWYDSPLGKLQLTCTDLGLTGLYMNREVCCLPEDHPVFRQTEKWLDAYFRGENPHFRGENRYFCIQFPNLWILRHPKASTFY